MFLGDFRKIPLNSTGYSFKTPKLLLNVLILMLYNKNISLLRNSHDISEYRRNLKLSLAKFGLDLKELPGSVAKKFLQRPYRPILKKRQDNNIEKNMIVAYAVYI